MIYLGNFRTITEELIEVEIITDNNSEDITDLLLASDPVTISSDSKGLFSPIKSDSATIRILTEEVYSDMYSNTTTQTQVKITNLTKNKVLFRGYLTPNIYSQDYTGLDVLELEAISAISALKKIKYKETTDIINWYDLIKLALTKVGYTSFSMSNSYKLSEKDDYYLLKQLYQFGNNFIDDDDEKTPWTYYEILEEFCKYFCYSLVVYNAEVYFIDYANKSDFQKYNLINDSAISFLHNGIYNITPNSYKETGAKISYDETFNKISVKDNLYEIDNILPDPMEDLENQNIDPNKFYENNKDIDGKNITYLNGFFRSKNWSNSQIVKEITPDNIESQSNISFWQKVDDYETENEPSSLKWKTYITALGGGTWLGDYTYKITSPIESKDLICNRGYFVINMDFKLSDNKLANECFTTSDQLYSTDKYSVDIEDTMFPCRLYVGDYYFDGERWLNKSEYLRKDKKGYYKSVAIGTFNPIPTWYKYKDKDGDWIFTSNKSEWDKATTEKLSGRSDNSNKVYYYTDDSGNRVYVDEDFYFECILKDRFYLVTKNKKDEKIFDTMKSLTNTVSWRMNMVDSEDGVAIKLPDFLLNGKLIFDLYTPSNLNHYGQYRTDKEVKRIRAVHISDFSMVYKVSGKAVDIFEGAELEDDVVYTNVINDDYVNEWDDIILKVNTQVEDRITSLSSMLYLPSSTEYYRFLEKVYDKSFQSNRILEECIIKRLYDHYKTPKLILEAALENKLSPLDTVKGIGKNFILDSYEINVADEVQNVKLIEL